jgi:hypothetical protein
MDEAPVTGIDPDMGNPVSPGSEKHQVAGLDPAAGHGPGMPQLGAGAARNPDTGPAKGEIDQAAAIESAG